MAKGNHGFSGQGKTWLCAKKKCRDKKTARQTAHTDYCRTCDSCFGENLNLCSDVFSALIIKFRSLEFVIVVSCYSSKT